MSKKDDEINRQLIFNSGGANPEDYLTPKQLQRYQDNRDKFIDIDVDLAMSNRTNNLNAYTRNRQENRPEFPEDRKKFGTEFLDTIGDRINETGFGKLRQKMLQEEAERHEEMLNADPKLYKQIFPEPNQTEVKILKGISDATQIDERISTPLTYAAIGGAAKGLGKIKPKHLGITQTIEPYTPPKGLGKTPRTIVNITDQVDDIMNMKPTKVQEIVKIAKKNKISYKKAEEYVNLKEQGIIPTQSINPGTNAGLIEGDLPLNVQYNRLQKIRKDREDALKGIGIDPEKYEGILQTGDTGMGGIGRPKKNESYPAFFDRMMQTHGATRVDGEWVMTEDAFKAIKNSNIRREIAQLILTDINQGVKG